MAVPEHLPLEITRNRVLGVREAAAFCAISVPHWRRLYRTHRAPQPIRLSSRKLGWRCGDLVDWIESRANA